MKLLIIADDLTGALDTGVKLAQRGASVQVALYPDGLEPAEQYTEEVLVVDAESRHLPPREAYRAVYDIVRRILPAWPQVTLYKKTDSALRGNIGAELAAALDASGKQKLVFAPALPCLNRITVNAVQLVDGIPIAQSDIGNDFFDPVVSSHIPELIVHQADIPVRTVGSDAFSQIGQGMGKEIVICDSSNTEELLAIAEAVRETDCVLAGCAGFAEALSGSISFGGLSETFRTDGKPFAIICGSINPIAQRQLAIADEVNIMRYTIPADILLGENAREEIVRVLVECLNEKRSLIVDANDITPNEKMDYAKARSISKEEMRRRISRCLGAIAEEIVRIAPCYQMVLVGGDTLAGFLDRLRVRKIKPITEIMQGCVLSSIYSSDGVMPIISKSGGFGDSRWLPDLVQKWGQMCKA